MLELDGRGLAHPEPLEKSVAMFETLESGGVLHLRIHRLPVPLLQIAEGRGLRYAVHEAGEGDFHILFTRDADVDLRSVLRERADV